MHAHLCVVLALTGLGVVLVHPLAAQTPTPHFKVAAFNIQSGTGEPGLAGRTATFVKNQNCTDPTQPMNAWGVGFVQNVLTRDIGSDTSIVALALSEAWESLCGSPQHVQAVLGWAARTSGRNGIALLSRYGFAGPEQWFQLDTSTNVNPADTMWVVRAPVCLDQSCTTSIPVFATHWFALGGDMGATYTKQADQTIAFMRSFPASPHVLIGDLNVWEEPPSTVCGQPWMPFGLDRLRTAGYLDAWRFVHGTDEGFTGMTNRKGCGVPEGYVWKRIDYAWSTLDLPPISMTRFAVVPPGEEAASDHYGVIAEYGTPGATDSSAPVVQITSPTAGRTVSGVVSVAISASDNVGVTGVNLLVDGTLAASTASAPWQFSWNTAVVADGQHTLQARAFDAAGNVGTSAPVAVTVANAAPSGTDIVLYARNAGVIAGAWRRTTDATAAAGESVAQPDAGAAKITQALASPANYFELSFDAVAGQPYRLWLRLKAERNYYGNDSVYVQFGGAVNASGQGIYQIGTTSATVVVLEDCSGCAISGWGWQDNGYGLNALGPVVYFDSSGRHTIRIQAREDGIAIDQIVLSPTRYLTVPPGAVRNDATILPASSGGTSTAPSEIIVQARNAVTIAGAWRRTSDTTAAGGESVAQPDAGAAKLTQALASPANYFDLTFDAVAGQPYRLWLRLKAERNYYGNDSVYVQFAGAVNASKQAVYQIGTTSATVVVLEDCSGCAISGWGWQDNGYGLNVLGPLVYFDSTGRHTIRIQAREDGIAIDQIVLSPKLYLTTAPGAVRNDATILVP